MKNVARHLRVLSIILPPQNNIKQLEFYMTRSFRCILLTALCLIAFASSVHAEENSIKKYEEAIPMPKQEADLNKLKRAKVTEEQAVNQLKFMMVKGFARMEKELIESGDFPPFGLTLSPTGEFKALTIDAGDVKVPTEVQLAAVAKNLEAIAQTRAMWGVGLMYIRVLKLDDGSFVQRIVVMAEHIAGWARHWVYPFKVEDGVVKLGQPTETEAKPVYYSKK